MHLTPCKQEHKELFDKAYARFSFPLAEHSFAWLRLWKDCYKNMEWAQVHSNLCLFITFKGTRYIWGPPLPGVEIRKTLSVCFSHCDEYNQKIKSEEETAVLYLPEELALAYGALSGFELKEQNKDYIYERKAIIELKGDKYKSQRNARNYFLKNYNYKIEQYDKKKHLSKCQELLERWFEKKCAVAKEQEKLLFEKNANKEALKKAEELNLKGIVILIDGTVEGFSFGEQTTSNMCTIFFEKTNHEVKGLSAFIYSEFLTHFQGNYVNAGEDWDVSYLKNTKLHYKPHLTKNSYSLSRKK